MTKMRRPLLIPGIIGYWIGLLLLSGCNSTGHDNAHIPPPYSADFESRKESDRLAFLTDCIRRRIDLSGSYYKRAKIYLEKDDFASALDDINHAIAAKDNVGEYYLLRGIVNRELNRLDDALLDAERAEALQQKSPRLYILMADILQENKKYGESARYINGVLALAPYDASVHYVQGMLQTKTGDTLQGLLSMEKALELNPEFFRAYPRASSIYTRRGDFYNAQRILTKGLQYFPSNTGLLVETGRLYSERSLPDSALIYYTKALQADKGNLDILVETAALYTRSRNYPAALRIYEDIQRQKPDYTAINYLIGFCQEKMWRFNTAKSYYEKELEITPGYVPARNGLWRISQQENERARSESDLNSGEEQTKTLDDSRLDVTPIAPRKIQN